MPTVYVTQETNHDFSSAEGFGDVVFLTHQDFINIRHSAHNEGLLSDLSFKLKKYDPEQDYIVTAGSPYVIAAVFLLLGARAMRSIRILRWDNRDRKYIPLFIELRRETDVKEAQQ